MSIRWFIREPHYSEKSQCDTLVTVVHDGGRTVLRVEYDLMGASYFRREGPEVSEQDMDELKTDLWRHQGSEFGPIHPKYRSETPL